MKKFLIAICCFLSGQSFSQKTKTENLIIVTLDGMRWQEIFGGIDSQIVVNHKFTRDSANVTGLFGASERNERRKKLFPFLWETVAVQGQLYGDRLNGSEVNNANRYKFSYPGYNEIFTGYPDTNVNSNDKIKNPNTNCWSSLPNKKDLTGKLRHLLHGMFFPTYSIPGEAVSM